LPALNHILAERIAAAEKRGVKRVLPNTGLETGGAMLREGRRLLNFSGNDYLGLRTDARVVEAAQTALAEYGAGSGAARLVSGNHPLHAPLEEALAAYKQTEAALVFGSGYLANIGVISAVAEEGDLILADKLAHACMLDGARLSGAALRRFAHNDMAHLEQLLQQHRGAHRHCLIVTESVFSMDGDRAPLSEIRALADAYDAWVLVDDAHGIGFGAGDASADIWVGTLSKALGSYGGYVAGSRVLVDFLVSHARSFIFSTALPPASVAAAHRALQLMLAEPKRAARVLTHARAVAEALSLPFAASAILPIVLGTPEAALEASRRLQEGGFYVAAIRPPTVPPGTARLRVTFSAQHSESDIAGLIVALQALSIAP
jgi:8-amino-7-oxononanoate synthase